MNDIHIIAREKNAYTIRKYLLCESELTSWDKTV